MFEVKKLTIKKISTSQMLVNDLSFVLNRGDKFALIGVEGNGKSTLMKVLLEKPTTYVEVQGVINPNQYRIGYLPQLIKEVWEDIPVIDYLLKDHPNDHVLPEDYARLNLLDKQLAEVYFDLDVFSEEKTIGQFSGGEVVKLGLVKELLKEPDILFLDEPTNDLDLETILFLEQFINEEKRPILFVSHDEALLENTANGIIHLVKVSHSLQAMTFVDKCDYVTYKTKRKMMLESQEMIAKKQRRTFQKKMERFRQVYEKVKHRQDQVVRDPTQGRLLKKKMKSLKSTESRYMKEQDNFLDFPVREEEINLFFNDDIYIPNQKVVCDITIERLMVENKCLSKNVNLFLRGQEKIAIIGKNGSGKTTLLREILHTLQETSSLRIGYMSQFYDETIDHAKNIVDFLMVNVEKYPRHRITSLLGSLHFTREEMLAKPNALSGGQRAKLLLLKLVISEVEVLILDEPTRNLSPLSIPIIHQMLLKFQGAIIAVTHDRSFIEHVFDKVYVLTEDGLTEL